MDSKEQEIIDLIRSKGCDSILLSTLIDLGDEVDEDGDTYAITYDTLSVENGVLRLYDSSWSDDYEDGIDYKDINEDGKKSCEFALKYTFGEI
jgi:hypothetical protein